MWRQSIVLQTLLHIMLNSWAFSHFEISQLFNGVGKIYTTLVAFITNNRGAELKSATARRSHQGAKKETFPACHSGKLKLTFTSPDIILTSLKNVLMSRLISQFFCNLNSSKKFIYTPGKLITEFTSLIAKSTSPWLLDTAFFARCCMHFPLPKALFMYIPLRGSPITGTSRPVVQINGR